MGEFDVTLNLAIERLVQEVHPFAVYLFGSAAKGRMNADSDVDLAFASDISIGNYEVFLLAQSLANILNRDVDLVNLSRATSVFRAEIVSTGKAIYVSDIEKHDLFVIRTLKEYALLNEERQPILQALYPQGGASRDGQRRGQ